MDLTQKIRNNYNRVMEEVATAAQQAGRVSEDVRVVTVSKGQPLEVVRAAVAAGITIFGENYPEETVPKITALGNETLEWHMIGHLQSRKVRLVAGYFDWMQSVDRLEIAEKLDHELAEGEKKLPILLEFNVGGEESKSGWQAGEPDKWDGLLADVEKILGLPNLQVRGLMTMPPLTASQEEARGYFRRLRRLRDYLAIRFPGAELSELSMGTSADYVSGVLEGATLVRVGQAILGMRPKKSK